MIHFIGTLRHPETVNTRISTFFVVNPYTVNHYEPSFATGTWMSQEVSKWLGSAGYTPNAPRL